MTLTRHFFLVVFALINSFSFGQVPKKLFSSFGIDEYNSKQFTLNKAPLLSRVGVYSFGESESEWDLVVLEKNDSLIIQIWSGMWGEEIGKKDLGWIRQCKTFNSVKIVDNKFFFGKYCGFFAEYKHDKKVEKAILLTSSPTFTIDRQYGKDSAEVGLSYISIDAFFNDRDFPELSLKIQPEEYFKGRTKQELKIMRNTIYAKYGQIFQEGGEMNKYFKNKNWYTPFQKVKASPFQYFSKVEYFKLLGGV